MASGYLEVIVGPVSSGKSKSVHGTIVRRADVNKRVWPNKRNCLMINHSFDNCENGLSTNSSQKFVESDNVDYIKSNNLKDINIKQYDVIGIDETQFFSNVKEIILHWVDDLGKEVYIAGLDGDSGREEFNQKDDSKTIIDILTNVINGNSKMNIDELMDIKTLIDTCIDKQDGNDDSLKSFDINDKSKLFISKNDFSNLSGLVSISDKYEKISADCELCLKYGGNRVPAPFSHKIIKNKNKLNIGKSECFRAVCRYHYNILNNGNIFEIDT